jgi:hypothetical protein
MPDDPVEAVWEHFFELSADEATTAFVSHWDNIRCLPDEGPLARALELAYERPIDFRPEHISIPSGKYKRFLSFAGWLQVTTGHRAIYLPTHKVARIFGVKPMTVSRWRQAGVRDGLLRVVREHEFRSKGASLATEFRFDVCRVPMLEEKAARGCVEGFRDGA